MGRRRNAVNGSSVAVVFGEITCLGLLDGAFFFE